MQTKQAETTSRELIERWIVQNILEGKSNDQLVGTMFVYGNEAFMLTQSSTGALEIVEQRSSQVIVFRKKEDAQPVNSCRACGTDYSSIKEAIECCADVD